MSDIVTSDGGTLTIRGSVLSGNKPTQSQEAAGVATNAGGIVGFITGGINAVKDALTRVRMSLINAVADFATTPVRAGIVILGAVTASIVLQIIFDILKKNAVFMTVVTFLQSIGKIITSLGSFFQVDVLITLMQLGYAFLPEFHENLAKIYEALGALSEEIGKDASFIMVFSEVARAILHSAYALTKNGWVLSEMKFAEGMSAWLGGIKTKMNAYMQDPSKIFTDIQASVAAAAQSESDTRIAEIWAGIDLVKDGIKSAGDEIISLLDELDRIKKDAPQEIQDAMAVWYVPFRADFDKFLSENWGPFWTATEKNMEIVARLISDHGLSIEEIQKRIKSPADLFRVMFNLPEAKKAAAVDDTRGTIERILYGDYIPESYMSKEVMHRLADAPILPDLRDPIPFIPPSIPRDLSKPSGDVQVIGLSWFRGE